ncbi:hypothetical protein H7347_06930 [Corynebacterium sp. zg-331]|uniref:hypothetical protein n=1 Tax=unclassified Corynebacterium TaxID=2624378 RepID=UPI00128CF76C|nr:MULTISPECIES: hypothetical protein [unclassified Corynebacterium]MBC3186306.1 hypothetical protein [Corynebacterium sp. zg-331]MPV52794.1 hypothetical protein [Corynebacterium sp. zg331]
MTTTRTTTVAEADLRQIAQDLNVLIAACHTGGLPEAGQMATALAETIAEMIPRTTAADLPAAERAHLPGAFCLIEGHRGLWVAVAVIDDARAMLCSSTSPSPDLVTVDLDEITVLSQARAWDYRGHPVPPADWEELLPIEGDEDDEAVVEDEADEYPEEAHPSGTETPAAVDDAKPVLAEATPIGWSEFVVLESQAVVRGHDGMQPIVATKLRRGRWQVEGVPEVLHDEDAWDALGGDGQVEELRA